MEAARARQLNTTNRTFIKSLGSAVVARQDMAANEAFIIVDPSKFDIQMATTMSSDNSFRRSNLFPKSVVIFIYHIHIHTFSQMCMPHFCSGDMGL